MREKTFRPLPLFIALLLAYPAMQASRAQAEDAPASPKVTLPNLGHPTAARAQANETDAQPCFPLDPECGGAQLKTVRASGEILTGAEHSLFQQARSGEMKDALTHQGNEFYVMKFDEGVYLLVNEEGDSIQVNSRGLEEFRSGKAISEANIGLTFAPGMTLGEVAAGIARNIPLVLLPGGGGITMTAIAHALAAQTLSKGIGFALNEAGVNLSAINPLRHIPSLMPEADQGLQATTDRVGRRAAISEAHCAACCPDTAQCAQPLTPYANYRQALLTHAREKGVIGVKMDMGPNNRGGDVNESPLPGYRALTIGTQQSEGDLNFNTKIGVATDTITTSSAVGTSDPRKVSSGVLSFGVDNGKTDGLVGGGIQLGATNLQGATPYSSQGYSVENPNTKYKEVLGSLKYKVGETGTTVTPFAGVGAETFGGNHAVAKGVAGVSLNQKLADGVSIDAGYRHSPLDSRGMLNVNFETGNIPMTVNLINPSLSLYPFKALFAFGDADMKESQVQIEQLKTEYQAAKDPETRGSKILAFMKQMRQMARNGKEGLMLAAVQSDPMQDYLARSTEIGRKLGEKGQKVEKEVVAIPVITIDNIPDPASIPDDSNMYQLIFTVNNLAVNFSSDAAALAAVSLQMIQSQGGINTGVFSVNRVTGVYTLPYIHSGMSGTNKYTFTINGVTSNVVSITAQ